MSDSDSDGNHSNNPPSTVKRKLPEAGGASNRKEAGPRAEGSGYAGSDAVRKLKRHYHVNKVSGGRSGREGGEEGGGGWGRREEEEREEEEKEEEEEADSD